MTPPLAIALSLLAAGVLITFCCLRWRAGLLREIWEAIRS